MKILNSRLHGLIDYIVVAFLMVAPTLFELSDLISTLSYVLGLVHLMLTLFTNFQLGLVKVIPLKRHGLVELVVSIVLMSSPLILDDHVQSAIDKFFFCGLGVVVLLTWAITDYSANDSVS